MKSVAMACWISSVGIHDGSCRQDCRCNRQGAENAVRPWKRHFPCRRSYEYGESEVPLHPWYLSANQKSVVKIGHIVDTVLINQKAPNSPQSSRSFIRSADDRARREISTPSTAPTSPKDKFVMSWAKLGLLERPDSDIPRSTSITGMCYSGQPSDNAFS